MCSSDLAVKKRARWIYEQLRDFRQQLEHVTPRRYVSGESHLYLGKQYLLKVIVAPSSVQGVKLLRGKLEVSVRKPGPETVKAQLTQWYRTRARELFAKRLDAMLEQALWVVDRPPLRLLNMQTQWGSCSPNGRITLNPHLVKAPRECIDYVCLHELCHLVFMDHSKDFWALVGKFCPDWRGIREEMKG